MHTRAASLVSVLYLIPFAPHCVVYRDRIVTVQGRLHVDVRGGPPSTLRDTRALGPSSELPTVQTRLDPASMRAALDVYGEWVEHPAYGVIWIPSLQNSQDFAPYGTHGSWRPTDAGWYWQSSLSWGWVTFHYGRWVQIEHTWAWVPGSVFAPAWVDWRQGSGWVGWSPLPPLGATYTAAFTYCTSSDLSGPGLWARVVRGAPATSLYARTIGLATAYGYGGTVYAWGPSAVSAGVPAAEIVPLATAHSVALAVAVPPPSHPQDSPPAAVGRPVASSTLSALREIPSVIVSDVPATGGTREMSAFPAYSTLRAADPTRLANSALNAPAGAPVRLQSTVTLGSIIDPNRAVQPSARVATWERYNGLSYSPGSSVNPSAPIARIPSAPSSYFDAPATMATTRPLTTPSAMVIPGTWAPRATAPGYNPTHNPGNNSAPAYNALPSSFNAQSPRVYNQPSYNPPSYVVPSVAYAPAARAYNPPSYSPPAYSPPSYSPPAYAAPSYAAPSYVAAPVASSPVATGIPVLGGAGMGTAVRFR